MTDTVISCKGLTKIYPMYNDPRDRFKEAFHPFRKTYHKEFFALQDVSFDIYQGETVGIIGHNGAGKSTLLKIITGVLTPTKGDIQVKGVVSSILELGTGFNLEATGIENIYINCSLMGISKSTVDSRIDRIVAFADIGDHINQPVKGYSSGMFARLAMAVAINVEPDVLIVDEALAVGDMNFQAKCMTAMKEIQARGTTVLFVSHDINSIKSLCDKCIYLKNGMVHASGKASEVTELYIKEMREELNSQNERIPAKKTAVYKEELESKCLDSTLTDNNTSFKHSIEFENRVEQFRYGTGEARITYVELLDDSDMTLTEVAFNQEVKVRIHLESYSDLEVAVNFQIYDDKKINITAGGFKQLSEELLKIGPGDRYIVDYVLSLPLQSNNYSIQTNISSFVPDTNTPIFIDCVPDSLIFKVGSRPNFPIWSKVDLFPKLSYSKI